MLFIGCLLALTIVAPRVMLILAWLFNERWDIVYGARLLGIGPGYPRPDYGFQRRWMGLGNPGRHRHYIRRHSRRKLQHAGDWTNHDLGRRRMGLDGWNFSNC